MEVSLSEQCMWTSIFWLPSSTWKSKLQWILAYLNLFYPNARFIRNKRAGYVMFTWFTTCVSNTRWQQQKWLPQRIGNTSKLFYQGRRSRSGRSSGRRTNIRPSNPRKNAIWALVGCSIVTLKGPRMIAVIHKMENTLCRQKKVSVAA